MGGALKNCPVDTIQETFFNARSTLNGLRRGRSEKLFGKSDDSLHFSLSKSAYFDGLFLAGLQPFPGTGEKPVQFAGEEKVFPARTHSGNPDGEASPKNY